MVYSWWAYLESIHLLGDVNCSEVYQLAVLSILVISQECQHWDDPVRVNQQL